MAPIDPAQLLKALDSLLSVDGGIKSIEDVPRLARVSQQDSINHAQPNSSLGVHKMPKERIPPTNIF